MSRDRQKLSEKATAPEIRTQAQRFIEAARELGADEDEATFKAKLGVIARQKVKDASATDFDMGTSDKSKT